MAQLSAAIDGIAEACTALGTPITGGNVSLYNETRGEGIYPTPVLGIVGILDDVTKAVPAHFQKTGEHVIVIGPKSRRGADWMTELGSSQFAKVVLGAFWGRPPALDLKAEGNLHKLMAILAEKRLITSASDVSEGGLAVTLAEAGFKNGIGAAVYVDHLAWQSASHAFFSEDSTQVVLTAPGESTRQVIDIAEKEFGFYADIVGQTTADYLTIFWSDRACIQSPLAELQTLWASALEANLHNEVTA
jgi:phosphoribosylformylglycinamidine synthase subunit PurL